MILGWSSQSQPSGEAATQGVYRRPSRSVDGDERMRIIGVGLAGPSHSPPG